MGELVCVKIFLNSMEAELAKNCLEAEGIQAMISADDAGGMRPELSMQKGIRLVVSEENADHAREILEGHEQGTPVSEADREDAENQAKQRDEAAREFQAMEFAGLRHKAASLKSNIIQTIVSLLAGFAIVLVAGQNVLLQRLGFCFVVYAIIQIFICHDCLKARRELEQIEREEKENS